MAIPLAAVMMGGSLLMQGASTIKGILGSRKAKKQKKAMIAQMQAQTQQQAQQLRQMMGQTLGPMAANYMGPSGIQAGQHGIGQAGGLPPFVG